jgi:hypothetical protein
MATNIRTPMGIPISTRTCMLRRTKKKVTSILIHTNMNTRMSISTNIFTKAHLMCMNIRKANMALTIMSIPDTRQKSMNIKIKRKNLNI